MRGNPFWPKVFIAKQPIGGLPFVLLIIADVSKGCVLAGFDVTFYSNERPSEVINGRLYRMTK